MKRRLRTTIIPKAGLAGVSVAVLAALAAAAALPAFQEEHKPAPYALIFGTVFGPDARPLYGVKIKIRRAQEKKSRWELYSDRRGEFAQRLPAGQADYVVWADVRTPKGGAKPQVAVHIDQDERQDIMLHLTQEEVPR